MIGQERFFKNGNDGEKDDKKNSSSIKSTHCSRCFKGNNLDFQRKIKQLQSLYEIPDDLILTFDQTLLPYVCSLNHTLHGKGALSVPTVGKGKKKQITGTLTVSKSGNFLPPHLFMKKKNKSLFTKRCFLP